MADVKVYKNEDYIASRVKHDNGEVEYFIKYKSSTHPQEIKVSKSDFMLYVDEFRKSHERQRNEKRRHIHDEDIEEIDENTAALTHTTDFSRQYDVRVSVEMVLKSCTPIQQRRFTLHRNYGYSLTEIAKMEKCDESAIRRSVNVVDEKIKNLFF